MSSAELQYIRNEAPNRTSVPRIRLHMERVFGFQRYYSRNLLNRILIKSQKEFLGNDNFCIEELFKHCEHIKQEGGIFISRHCEASLKLTGYSVQTLLEKKLIEVYGTKLFYLDSTHNTSRHNLKICPPSVIDCFGMTAGVGLSTFDAEASEEIDIVLKDLSLDNVGSVAGVDQAPCWDIPFENAGIIKLHDTWHFGRDINKAASGLEDKYQIFRDKCNKALYHDFGDSVVLDLFLGHLEEEYKSFPKANKLVKTLIKLKRNLCKTYTHEYFHCSNGGMSRGEGVMSRLKGNGKLKQSMRKWSLWELQLHYDALSRSYMVSVSEQIRKYLKNNCYCSELVSKKMEEASSDSSLYQLVKPMGHKKLLYKVIFDEIRNIHGRTYHVKKKNIKTRWKTKLYT